MKRKSRVPRLTVVRLDNAAKITNHVTELTNECGIHAVAMTAWSDAYTYYISQSFVPHL